MNLRTRTAPVDQHSAAYRSGQQIIIDLLWEHPAVDLPQIRSYVQMTGTYADATGNLEEWARARGALDLIEEVLTSVADT